MLQRQTYIRGRSNASLVWAPNLESLHIQCSTIENHIQNRARISDPWKELLVIESLHDVAYQNPGISGWIVYGRCKIHVPQHPN